MLIPSVEGVATSVEGTITSVESAIPGLKDTVSCVEAANPTVDPEESR